jgi:hypothetical protein
MTRSEAATLLAFCAAYDQRTVGQADVAAWFLALQRYPLGLARDAVTAHYRERRDRIMPADITAHIRAQRRPDAAPLPVIEGPKASPEHIARCRAQMNAVIIEAAARFTLDDDPDEVPMWRPGMDKQQLALAQAEASRRRHGDIPHTTSCDCPCHRRQGVTEGMKPCCGNAGLCYLGGDTYLPWPLDQAAP